MEYEMIMRVVARSIETFGFVVVSYKLGREPAIGARTNYLWSVYKMPQIFVVVREATKEEWAHQKYLVEKIVGKKAADHPQCKRFVLMTD